MGKKIYIAYTGGTIGMRHHREGYEPAPGYLQELMRQMPELANPEMPGYAIQEYTPLIDSSDMHPRNWMAIARDIAANYDRYDGFVILHGTDTMAYTASALPFMLRGLGKPVILTGGQIPLCEVRNDSRENLITAMLIAARYRMPEVALFFGNKLLRGNRAVKVSADGFAAFDSPNLPPLGRAGLGIHIDWDLILPITGNGGLNLIEVTSAPVGVLRLFPGISADIVANLLAPPIRGVVLETYGVGNGPSSDGDLLEAIRAASRRGVLIVNCTQCLQGRVRMGAYATGAALEKAGVISGFDLTTEAALAKMICLFSRNLSQERIIDLMQTPLAGEMTLPTAG
ncbi:MAG: asparaginase [Desulfosarcinaceae bacterium]|nr:asparaginase [Desulfosarcinaceae bacterium]